MVSSGWCWVHPHHKLTDHSESISHDFDPSGQRKLYLIRYLPKFAVMCLDTDSDPLVNFMCYGNMATSIDTLPLEMLCHIFSFLGSDVPLVCWNISTPRHLVITQ